MINPVILTVQSVQEGRVQASSAEGQTWNMPLEAVIGTPKPGTELRVIAAAMDAENGGTTELAKAILNELLGKSPA